MGGVSHFLIAPVFPIAFLDNAVDDFLQRIDFLCRRLGGLNGGIRRFLFDGFGGTGEAFPEPLDDFRRQTVQQPGIVRRDEACLIDAARK